MNGHVMSRPAIDLFNLKLIIGLTSFKTFCFFVACGMTLEYSGMFITTTKTVMKYYLPQNRGDNAECAFQTTRCRQNLCCEPAERERE